MSTLRLGESRVFEPSPPPIDLIDDLWKQASEPATEWRGKARRANARFHFGNEAFDHWPEISAAAKEGS